MTVAVVAVLLVGVGLGLVGPTVVRRIRTWRSTPSGLEPCERCSKPAHYVVFETYDDDGEGNPLPPGFGAGMSAHFCRQHRPENAQRVT